MLMCNRKCFACVCAKWSNKFADDKSKPGLSIDEFCLTCICTNTQRTLVASTIRLACIRDVVWWIHNEKCTNCYSRRVGLSDTSTRMYDRLTATPECHSIEVKRTEMLGSNQSTYFVICVCVSSLAGFLVIPKRQTGRFVTFHIDWYTPTRIILLI